MLLFTAGAGAHPHMFIDTSVTFEFEEQTLEGFWIEWGFDEIFSGSIRLDYDRNRDGSLSEKEQELIRRNAFANLRNFHYFTTVRHDGTEWKADTVKHFSARLEENRLYYRFFVPYRIEVEENPTEATVVIFDHTFYSDIAYVEKNPVRLNHAEGLRVQTDIRINRDNPITYDPLGGRKRSSADNRAAAGKAYPYEIKVTMRAE
jgi:ABC-type uncharacterized transport system substrate-binding protein